PLESDSAQRISVQNMAMAVLVRDDGRLVRLVSLDPCHDGMSSLVVSRGLPVMFHSPVLSSLGLCRAVVLVDVIGNGAGSCCWRFVAFIGSRREALPLLHRALYKRAVYPRNEKGSLWLPSWALRALVNGGGVGRQAPLNRRGSARAAVSLTHRCETGKHFY